MTCDEVIKLVSDAITLEYNEGRAFKSYEIKALENLYRGFEYAVLVVNKEKTACKYIVKACQRFLDDFDRVDDINFRYSFKKAIKVLKFYATCVTHVKGSNRTTGKIIELMDWHCFILINIFGWQVPLFEVEPETGEPKYTEAGDKIPVLDDGQQVWVRRFRTVYAEVARKNAKSTLSSGIGLYMTGFDGEGGAEVYSAATTRDQARIVFDDAKKMINNSKLLKRRLGAVKLNIHQVATESKFEPLSADANTLDGLNIHCGIVDELHAHKTRDVWDVLETATGSRDQSLILAITTAGTILDGICYEIRDYAKQVILKTGGLEDDSFFGVIYTLDDDDDPFDEKVWFKSNPGLGISKSWDDIRRLAKKAKSKPDAIANFKTKHLNIWVRNGAAWLKEGMWESCAMASSVVGDRCVIGIDLADKLDLCAAVKVRQSSANLKKVSVYVKFWLPEGRLDECSSQMKQIYKKFSDAGFLELLPGTVIDHDEIEEDLKAWADGENLECFAFDPWKSNHLTKNLEKGGYPVIEVGQSVKNLSQVMKETQAAIYSGDIEHEHNGAMEWMMSNLVVEPDRNGNIFPRKESAENKIDGPVAMFTAMNRLILGGGEGNYDLTWYDDDEDVVCF
ncbi:TPA: terminase large subunit [Photobacterium damselae]